MGREFSFSNVNLCESNILQIFELNFCNSERTLFTYLHRKIILILFWNIPIRLEEVDKQPSLTSIFYSASVKQNEQLWSVHPRWRFRKTSIVSVSMSSDPIGGKTIRFFFHFNNQTLLHCWFYWNMRRPNEVLFLKEFAGNLS